MKTFDEDTIVREADALMQGYYQRLSIEMYGPLMRVDPTSLFAETVRTVVRAANGQIDTNDLDAVGEAREAIQAVAEALFAPPAINTYVIPDSFWMTPLGQAMMHAQVRLTGDTLISRADAARRLYGDASTRNLMRVARLCDSGALTSYRDPSAPPRQNSLVSAREVEALYDPEHVQAPPTRRPIPRTWEPVLKRAARRPAPLYRALSSIERRAASLMAKEGLVEIANDGTLHATEAGVTALKEGARDRS